MCSDGRGNVTDCDRGTGIDGGGDGGDISDADTDVNGRVIRITDRMILDFVTVTIEYL